MDPHDLGRLALPPNLPVPIDDGAAAHLSGMAIPPVALASTAGRAVRLDREPGTAVVYAYPRTGTPDVPVPAGWDDIPGARGCTPQSCAFRDHHAELRALGATVFGLSTQSTPYQAEMAARLRLPFEVLSDASFELTRALRLPTFTFEGVELLRRLTLVVEHGRIRHVFYPVFPPDRNPQVVAAWLRDQGGTGRGSGSSSPLRGPSGEPPG
jgi:peroxiredoxin